jgi:hypothetical protein
MMSSITMKRFHVLLCLLALLGPVGAHAQALQARSCDAWNTARKANLSSAVQREWLFGYLNGWRDAQLAQKGQDIFQTLPAVESLIEKANAFCEAHPTAVVNQSISALLNGASP